MRRRASARGTPSIRSVSYGVSVCRTDARTAAVTASGDSVRPAALPHPPASAHRRMRRDRLGPIGRAPGKQPPDLLGERLREPLVLRGPPPGVPHPASAPGLRVRQTPLLGPCECLLLDEQPLPLVAAVAPVEAHHHRRERARLPGPPRQRGVAPRQEHQMPEVRTVQAAWRALLQHQQGQRPSPAPGAVPSFERLDHEKSCPGRRSWGRPHIRFIPHPSATRPRRTGSPPAGPAGAPSDPVVPVVRASGARPVIHAARSRAEPVDRQLCRSPPGAEQRVRALDAASWALCDSKRSPGNGSATFSPTGCST